jgi:hypothetical protein
MQLRRSRVVAVAFALGAPLGACAGAASDQPVATEAQAVRIAKDRCTWTRPFAAGEQWHAKLHQGQWHVWLVRDRDPREPVVGTLDIWIRAADGEAGSCNRAPY